MPPPRASQLRTFLMVVTLLAIGSLLPSLKDAAFKPGVLRKPLTRVFPPGYVVRAGGRGCGDLRSRG